MVPAECVGVVACACVFARIYARMKQREGAAEARVAQPRIARSVTAPKPASEAARAPCVRYKPAPSRPCSMEEYIKCSLFEKARDQLFTDPEMNRLFVAWHDAADQTRCALREANVTVLEHRQRVHAGEEVAGHIAALYGAQSEAYAAWHAYIDNYIEKEGVTLTPDEEAEARNEFYAADV